ncbi:hypothetical protein [Polaribacter sp.]|uniref:hypothetical protein n=1 Tax=Polaribacter sp. TaxID=1920175 RepID=UPI003F6BB3B1
MKKVYRIISTMAIILFVISFVLNRLAIFTDYNSMDLQSIFVIIYLFTSLKYYTLEVKDKDAEIQHLKRKINKFE